jgi:hypothetical protein
MILAVLTTLGIRFMPEASAAESVTVGDFVIELTDDDQIRYNDTSNGIRYDDQLPPEYTAPTVEEVTSLLTEVNSTVKQDLGWDLTDPEDVASVRGERDSLAQALHSFDDSTLEVEETASLRKLRNLVDELEVAQCRERCTPGTAELLGNVITIVRIGSMVNEILSTINPDTDARIAVLAVTVQLTGLLSLPLYVIPTLTNIPSAVVQAAVLFSMKGLLSFAKSAVSDAQALNSKDSGTLAQQAHSEAQEIADLSPSEIDSGNDYDMVKDEL